MATKQNKFRLVLNKMTHTRSMHSYLYLFLLSLLFVVSCKSKKNIGVTSKNETVENLLKDSATDENKLAVFAANYSNWQTYSARGSVGFEGNGNSLSANLSFRMYKDSLIWASVNMLGGIEVARILITQDSIFIMDKMNRNVKIAPLDKMQEIAGARLYVSEVQNLILGNLLFEINKYRYFDGETKEEFYAKGKNRNIEVIHKYLISGLLIKDMSLQTTVGSKEKLEIKYSSHTQTNIFNVPQQMEITSQATDLKGMKVILNFSQPEFNKENLMFPFNIPSNYEREQL
jgi:hypothetical protein